jgi:hypothetical protein
MFGKRKEKERKRDELDSLSWNERLTSTWSQ